MKYKLLLLCIIIFAIEACNCPKQSFPSLTIFVENKPLNSEIRIITSSALTTDTFLSSQDEIGLDPYFTNIYIQLISSNSIIQSDTLNNFNIISSGRCNYLRELVGFKHNGNFSSGNTFQLMY